MPCHSLPLRLPLLLLLLLSLTPAARAVDAEGVTEDKKSAQGLKPYDRKAETTPADSPAAAQKGFRRAKIPVGFKADLWASEPLLANPVAFSFDGKGRMFIAETHRYRTSVLDIRHYMFMLEDDLANRNQADWERSIKKNFPNDWQELGKESEVVRLVEDTNGDGTADKTSVYADGFNSILDGIASGVLARPDGVWLANIPGLYKLTGQGADGKAEKKEEVFRGFGVRFNYTGHDLHGLIKGPDGRLYFSIGDRGASVKTKEGGTIEVPDEGAIFRCEEDGSHLELVMRGLRNPQELAFDDYGNLFTCDNDSDQGDRERLVYVVEGGDAGWRVGYQHCPQPAERNPWLAEHMWEPRDPAKNQPASILSPVANLPDGPGGLVHYPGTGLPEKYNGCFFLACYKGSSLTSQVAVFKPVPDGAGFKLEMLETFIPGCQATDVDFGPDSRLYVSFWDEGWERTAQGRIMKVEHEEARKAQTAQIAEVQKLLGEGMKQRSAEELVKLLGHKDQRVRLEAQWELAGRGREAMKLLNPLIESGDEMSRLHAIWTMMQIRRTLQRNDHIPAPSGRDLALFKTFQPAVQAAALRGMAVLKGQFDDEGTAVISDRLSADWHPAVNLTAAQVLGAKGTAAAIRPLLDLARREQDKSQEMRHVISWALAKLSQRSEEAWKAVVAAEEDKDPAVRMVSLQAAAHVARTPEKWYAGAADVVARFARYRELAPEVARLVNDRGLRPEQRLPLMGPDALTVLRGYNDAFRRGGVTEADRVMMALHDTESRPSPELIVEALNMLDYWTAPLARDRVNGLYRPMQNRFSGAPDLGVLTDTILESHPLVTARILDLIARQKRVNWSQWVSTVAQASKFPASLRAQALRTLGTVSAPELAATVANAIGDPNSTVRIAAAGLLGKTDPLAAASALESALAQGSPEDARAAFTELASLQVAEADRILAEQLILLTAGKVPAIARLELLGAAAKHPAPVVKEALAKYEASLPKDDVMAKFAACLEGGDAVNGKRLFNEHPVAACKRCHMVQKSGGEAGPPLDGIGARKDRRYLLESILLPNAQIAESFRMVLCNMKDGTVKTGVLRAETPDRVTIQNPGEEPETLKTADIASRDAVPSAMLPGMDVLLTKRELRDLVEYVASLKE